MPTGPSEGSTPLEGRPRPASPSAEPQARQQDAGPIGTGVAACKTSGDQGIAGASPAPTPRAALEIQPETEAPIRRAARAPR